MSELKVGNKAPGFSLKDKDGNTVRLNDIDSKTTVVYFYPKDDTPGCTIEAKEFTNSLRQFEKAGATVIGVSGGDEKSKQNFCLKHQIEVTLVSDQDNSTAEKYGAFGEKTVMGKKTKGIFRKTFVLDKDKKVLKVFEDVTPEGHSKEVLNYIKSIT